VRFTSSVPAHQRGRGRAPHRILLDRDNRCGLADLDCVPDQRYVDRVRVAVDVDGCTAAIDPVGSEAEVSAVLAPVMNSSMTTVPDVVGV
jgi:hypothetical protein